MPCWPLVLQWSATMVMSTSLFCDTPLLRAETLGRMAAALDGGANLVVLGFEAEDTDRLWPLADRFEHG